MLKKFTLLVFCCFSLIACGQSKDYSYRSKISPENLKTDFLILLTSLRENHPGLYDFTPEPVFDSLATASLNSLTDSLTEAEFHIVVRKLIHVIGCGHTTPRPSADWYESLRSEASLIPIHVFLQNEQLYVRSVFDEKNENLIGARLISIDGVSSSEILLEMKSTLEADGVGETMINRNTEKLFQTLYAFLNKSKPVYRVEAELTSGSVIESTLFGSKAVRYPVNNSAVQSVDIGMESAEFGFLGNSKKVAVLDLSGFSSKGYKKFYKKVFERLSAFDSIDLIIDLRGNGGGYFPNGNQLLRYLMNEKFTMDFNKPQKHTKNSKFLKLNVLSQMTRFIFSTIPDRNKNDPARNYQIRYKPIKKNHFDGQIYVISDGLTFSTGSFVASKLKDSRGAVIVGEETGGGEVGFNAVLSWKLTLPNSGVIVAIPIYHVNQQPEMENIGRGVMTNYSIQYTLEQRMSEVDLEIKQILELLEVK